MPAPGAARGVLLRLLWNTSEMYRGVRSVFPLPLPSGVLFASTPPPPLHLMSRKVVDRESEMSRCLRYFLPGVSRRLDRGDGSGILRSGLTHGHSSCAAVGSVLHPSCRDPALCARSSRRLPLSRSSSLLGFRIRMLGTSMCLRPWARHSIACSVRGGEGGAKNLEKLGGFPDERWVGVLNHLGRPRDGANRPTCSRCFRRAAPGAGCGASSPGKGLRETAWLTLRRQVSRLERKGARSTTSSSRRRWAGGDGVATDV